jgi:hypothetical protein
MNATQSNNLPLWVQNRDQILEHSPGVEWRYGKLPDYTRSNENLAKESTRNHPQGSLEAIVQNLVRAFDVEANFKINPQQWVSVVNDQFRMSTNGGRTYTVSDVVESGTYKLLIGNTEHYKASEENFETSTNLFHTAFPDGFLWEVLEVFSGPPTIAFKWRHWGNFQGAYKDYTPTGETVEVIGISVACVTDDLKILSLEHYYDNNKFLDKLTSGGTQGTGEQPNLKSDGKQETSEHNRRFFWSIIKRLWNWGDQQKTGEQKVSGCPFSALIR